MSECVDVDVQRDAALRKIGRNVVNFQKLEVSLKQILPTLRYAGPLREVQSLHAANVQKIRKKSLGELANSFHSALYAGKHIVPDPVESTEITITHSFHTELNSTEVAETKKALIRLVRERNLLIHFELASIDFSSIPACGELSVRLDEQNERICVQLNHLQALRQTHSEILIVLKNFIGSDEFLELISRDSDES